MREVDCQSKVIKAVRDAGGAAHKLSNRFLVGVPDLLCQLPTYAAFLLEVKLDKRTKVFSPVRPDVTPLQFKFLSEYNRAGMATGVLSFVQINRELWFYLRWLPAYERGHVFEPLLYQRFEPQSFINIIKGNSTP